MTPEKRAASQTLVHDSQFRPDECGRKSSAIHQDVLARIFSDGGPGAPALGDFAGFEGTLIYLILRFDSASKNHLRCNGDIG